MLGENIKTTRRNRGFTQEEVAARLNVVRQTVSKWEKGYSVPDAEMLKKLAEVLDTDVGQLLGSSVTENSNTDAVAEQLSRINEQLAVKNRRARRVWKTAGVILAVIVTVYLLLLIFGLAAYTNLTGPAEISSESVTEKIIS